MRIHKAQLFGLGKFSLESHLAPGNCDLLPKNVTFGRTAEFFLSARLGPTRWAARGSHNQKRVKIQKFLHFLNQREKLRF